MTVEEIVAGLRASNAAAVELVARLGPDEWHRLTPAEEWPVGVTAQHIALGHRQFVGWIGEMTAGGSVDPGDIDAVNAERAVAGVVAGPDEVAELIRHEGDAALAALTALASDDAAGEVDFGGRRMPRIALLGASVRHVDAHLASIRAAVGAGEPV